MSTHEPKHQRRLRPSAPTQDEFACAFAEEMGLKLGIDLSHEAMLEEDDREADNQTSDDRNMEILDLHDLLCDYARERLQRLSGGRIAINHRKVDDLITDISDILQEMNEKKYLSTTHPMNEDNVREFLMLCVEQTAEQLLGDRHILNAPKRSR